MLYIKFSKEKECYRITFTGIPTKGTNKIIKQYVEKHNIDTFIPQFVKT